ncbi:MAG: nucleoside-binding protein [Gammaproteobacteria bacterium]|nr:MAG: nucleoside-binding protein [Gammaproteobacteria bacterium]
MTRPVHALFASLAKILLSLIGLTATAYAANWSSTEVHLQYGKLDAPSFAGGESADTTIFTVQHASGWKYGSNFFFVDFLSDSKDDGFNDAAYYGEFYANISFAKIRNKKMNLGPINDIGLLLGLNFAPDVDVRKYLPGIRLSWSIPQFVFFNSDFMLYLDDSHGVNAGGAPSEDNAYILDLNFKLPFSVQNHAMSLSGHMEYITSRDNEFGKTAGSLLAQPQFRYDLGKQLFDTKDQLYVGIEYQYWRNKLGDNDTDESAVQWLVVWQL